MKNILEFSFFAPEKIRLDACLCEIMRISKREARNYCDNSFAKINGRTSKSGNLVGFTDLVSIELSLVPVVPGKINSTLDLEILHEDEDIIVINKPVATHCVRLKNSDAETIADWLANYCPQTLVASKDIRESGLVNRLDFFTSGVLLAAKSNKIWQDLGIIQTEKQMLKTYFALVDQRTYPQTINLPLENKSTTKVIIADSGRPAKTELVWANAIKYGNAIYSLVKLQGHAFARHQLRAHLSHLGNSLTGDEAYGGSNSRILGREGFFLHSENLKFEFKGRLLNILAKSKELEKLKSL